jgi:hypothetical protein
MTVENAPKIMNDIAESAATAIIVLRRSMRSEPAERYGVAPAYPRQRLKSGPLSSFDAEARFLRPVLQALDDPRVCAAIHRRATPTTAGFGRSCTRGSGPCMVSSATCAAYYSTAPGRLKGDEWARRREPPTGEDTDRSYPRPSSKA